MSQRRFAPGAFAAEYEPLVRKVISAQPENGLAELGAKGKFIYLVQDAIETVDLEINEQLAGAMTENGYSEEVASRFRNLNECLSPYIGKTLLRCGIWLAGIRHELYIDELMERVVHRTTGTHPDPDSVNPDPDNRGVE